MWEVIVKLAKTGALGAESRFEDFNDALKMVDLCRKLESITGAEVGTYLTINVKKIRRV